MTGHKDSSHHRVSDDVTSCKRFGNACNIEKCGTHAQRRSDAHKNNAKAGNADAAIGADAGTEPKATGPSTEEANPDPLFDAKEL